METLRVYLKEQSQIKYYVVKHLILQKNPKYDGYQRRLASVVYTFFHKITSNTNKATRLNSGVFSENKELVELVKVLHKLIIEKFKKPKLHSPFIDNIWGANLDDMQLLSKFNR